MVLWQLLDLKPGVICFTGSGGKTTLAHTLAAQLPGSVIFCTTTQILPSSRMPVLCGIDEGKLRTALSRHHAVCIGALTDSGKLTAPGIPIQRLREIADFVLVEADGSHQKPMKAHLPHEPALPEGFDRNLLVVGAGGFGCHIRDAAYRAERFAELAGARLHDLITPEMAASVLLQEGGFDTVIVNQVDSVIRLGWAGRMAAKLPCPVFAGQVQHARLVKL